MDAQKTNNLRARDFNEIYNLGCDPENAFIEQEESSEEKTKRKGKEILSDKNYILYRKTRVLNEDRVEYTNKRWGLSFHLPRFEFAWRIRF